MDGFFVICFLISLFGIVFLFFLPSVSESFSGSDFESFKGEITTVRNFDESSLLVLDAVCSREVFLYKNSNKDFVVGDKVSVRGFKDGEFFYGELVN